MRTMLLDVVDILAHSRPYRYLPKGWLARVLEDPLQSVVPEFKTANDLLGITISELHDGMDRLQSEHDSFVSMYRWVQAAIDRRPDGLNGTGSVDALAAPFCAEHWNLFYMNDTCKCVFEHYLGCLAKLLAPFEKTVVLLTDYVDKHYEPISPSFTFYDRKLLDFKAKGLLGYYCRRVNHTIIIPLIRLRYRLDGAKYIAAIDAHTQNCTDHLWRMVTVLSSACEVTSWYLKVASQLQHAYEESLPLFDQLKASLEAVAESASDNRDTSCALAFMVERINARAYLSKAKELFNEYRRTNARGFRLFPKHLKLLELPSNYKQAVVPDLTLDSTLYYDYCEREPEDVPDDALPGTYTEEKDYLVEATVVDAISTRI
ncbi:hypothetical protein PAPHI01_0555 [Pancytospora philotis]|nr:hypothetical protein PAPHI01_0555 [Pancytospora philotis]